MKYKIIDKKSKKTEYYIFKKDNEYSLYFSNTKQWNYPNSHILTFKDNGDNGFDVDTDTLNLNVKSLDYDIALYLLLMLQFIKRKDKNFCSKFKFKKCK